MLKFDKKSKIFLGLTLAVSLTAIILRLVLMIANFDYDSLFYINKPLATVVYAVVIICTAIVFIWGKKFKVKNIEYGKAYRIFDLLVLAVFAVIFINNLSAGNTAIGIAKALGYIELFSLLLALVYYLLSAFVKSKSFITLTRVMNIFPVVFIATEVIENFITASSKANTYYMLPNILSLLAISFFIINEAKQKATTSDSNVALCSYSAMTFILLAFSAIPDLYLIIAKRNTMLAINGDYVLFTVLKLVFIVISCYTIIKILTKTSEVKE